MHNMTSQHSRLAKVMHVHVGVEVSRLATTHCGCRPCGAAWCMTKSASHVCRQQGVRLNECSEGCPASQHH